MPVLDSDTVAVSGTLSVRETVRLSVAAIVDVVDTVKESVAGNDSVKVKEVDSESVIEVDSVAVGPEILKDTVAGIDSVMDTVTLSVMGSDSVVEKVPKVSETEVETVPEGDRDLLCESEVDSDRDTL